MNALSFDVIGDPASKGSVTKLPNGGYVHGSSGPARKKLASWATAVTDAATRAADEAGWQTLHGPVAVVIHFHFAQVASDPYRHRHVTAIDIDKACRAVFDHLKAAGIVADDSLISDLVASKTHARDGRTGATIRVEDLSDVEANDRQYFKNQAAETRRAAKMIGASA